MFKYLVFAALMAFAAAKPQVLVDYPYAAGYTAPVAAAYSAPVYSAYSAYTAPLAYSAYSAYPYSYYYR